MNLDLGDEKISPANSDGNCIVLSMLPADLTSLNLEKQSQVHPGVAEEKTVLKKKES